jgi:hypothetical protein
MLIFVKPSWCYSYLDANRGLEVMHLQTLGRNDARGACAQSALPTRNPSAPHIVRLVTC